MDTRFEVVNKKVDNLKVGEFASAEAAWKFIDGLNFKDKSHLTVVKVEEARTVIERPKIPEGFLVVYALDFGDQTVVLGQDRHGADLAKIIYPYGSKELAIKRMKELRVGFNHKVIDIGV